MAEALAATAETPFAWGAHDCWLAAADIAAAITGRDPAAADRGRYTTEEEAEAILAASGGLEAHVAAALEAFGAAECPPAFAQRGDLALVEVGNQVLLGVVIDHRVGAAGADRRQFVPLDLAIRCWAI